MSSKRIVKRPLVVGHRGAPGYLPEHTRASFELAIRQGVDAIEIDIVPAADGVLMIRHDREIGGTTDIDQHPEFKGRGPWFLDELSSTQLSTLRARERLPLLRLASAAHDGEEGLLTLTEVLELTAFSNVLLVIEIKDATLFTALGLDPVPLLRATLAAAPALPRIVLESFEKTPLLALADLGHPSVYLFESSGTAPDEALQGAAALTYHEELTLGDLSPFDGVGLPDPLISRARVDNLHARGLEVWTWSLRAENFFLPSEYQTSDSPSAYGNWQGYWSSLLGVGVDGVFVDQPDLFMSLLKD